MKSPVRSATLLAGVLLLVTVLPAQQPAVPVQMADGRSGMVVSGHPAATAAGVEILKAGGNVIDAVVAVSLSLGVTEPYGSGLGGKIAIVYREARTGKVTVVEALDAASTHLDAAAFRKAPADERKKGAGSVGVPGLAAGLMTAHERWGKLPRATVVAPAIKLAGDGFQVQSGQVRFFRAQLSKLQGNPALGSVYLPGGEIPRAGQRIVNADLAKTLGYLAEKGADGFYRGPVAEAIVKDLQSLGSPIALDDFAGYRARVTEPLKVKFAGIEVYSTPPPTSGGGIALLTLASLDGEKLPGKSIFAPEAMNRYMRVYLEANYAARATIGDIAGSRKDWEALLAAPSLARIREQASAGAASPALVWAGDEAADDGALAAETTHFVVMDREGNVASVTQSQSNHFGSGIMAAGTGVVLNNSLSNFATVATHPNTARPGGRPATTITPTILVSGGRTLAGVGLPGGGRIPATIVQVLVDRLLFGRSFDQAIGAPRFHPSVRPIKDRAPGFQTEKETDDALAETLKSRYGWTVAADEDTESFGGVNAIEMLPGGVLRGYADQRRSNAAAGY